MTLGFSGRLYNRRMRERRTALGLSLRALADRARVSLPSVGGYELLHAFPSSRHAEAISAALGLGTAECFPAWLAEFCGRPKSHAVDVEPPSAVAVLGERALSAGAADAVVDLELEAIETVDRERLAELVGSALLTLTPRERRVLVLRFGLDDERRHTLAEIGREFGVTGGAITPHELRALRKLRGRYGRALYAYLYPR